MELLNPARRRRCSFVPICTGAGRILKLGRCGTRIILLLLSLLLLFVVSRPSSLSLLASGGGRVCCARRCACIVRAHATAHVTLVPPTVFATPTRPPENCCSIPGRRIGRGRIRDVSRPPVTRPMTTVIILIQ